MSEPRKQATRTNRTAREYPEELERLEDMKQALDAALRGSDESVERYDREYREHQRYIVDHRHELDPKELFQSSLSLRDIDRAGAFAVRFRDKIAKLADSPYFARIDFRADTEAAPGALYIGRFAFSDEAEHVIYDWRAPVSSMFYDCEAGAASYLSPAGPVEGTLTRKRQFRIAGGKMIYCLETSVAIRDDVLQRELSMSADDKMKSIIATIQREQNQIIRNEAADVLVIQGVAGSGKTSIALHRVAYLLYRRRDRLTARDVAILSPNKVFGDYIGSVLPELGEEPVYQLSFVDIAGIQLGGVVGFQPPADPVEARCPELEERTRFKSTVSFLRRAEEYLEYATEQYFEPASYSWGDFTAPADYILERYRAYRKHPVKRRLLEVAGDVLSRFESQNRFDEDLPGPRTVARQLSALFKQKSTLALYKDFYRWLGLPGMLSMPAKNTLEWPDVYPFLYFHSAFAGLAENRTIRHLVVDEMQDYTPIQYAVLNLLFRCQKTILGDYGQLVHPYRSMSLEDFRQLYPGVEIVRLNTSYRSTYEIIEFAKGILDLSEIAPVERHGDKVAVICCDCEREALEAVGARIAAFRQSGASTMGIILKTREQARALYRQLRDQFEVTLLDSDSTSFAGGVSVTSVRMSKGLEFDEVLIPQADRDTYRTEFDRNLLYIACTRAMHKLCLICTGAPAEALRHSVAKKR